MSQSEHVREFQFLAPENPPVGLNGGQYQLVLEDINCAPVRASCEGRFSGLVPRVLRTGAFPPLFGAQ